MTVAALLEKTFVLFLWIGTPVVLLRKISWIQRMAEAQALGA